jgi:hypothetical protein
VLADKETSWTTAGTGLPTKPIEALAVSGGYLIAGTAGSGMWRRPLEEMVASVQPMTTGLPEGFSLDQNYPNPFNPATDVRYQLPVASSVKLVVYDLLGREVKVLVDEKKEPGRYEVQFVGSGLASGVYLYRLHAGTFTETKKLVLVR